MARRLVETARSRWRDERGAIVIYVAVAILVLTAFTSFVVDYGILWSARTQAQTIADYAAHAGAVALAYDPFDDTDPDGTTAATQAVQAVYGSMKIINAAPSSSTTSIGFTCPDGTTNGCVKVDVYRDAAHSNALPVYFGRLLGLTGQGVQASATAQAMLGGGTKCLAPIAIPDKWEPDIQFADDPKNDKTKVWDGTNKFEKYCFNDLGCTSADKGAPGDQYVPPTTTSGTGYRFTDPYTGKKSSGTIGRWITIDDISKAPLAYTKSDGKPGNYDHTITGKSYIPLSIARTVDTQIGLAGFQASIQTCSGTTVMLNDFLAYYPPSSGDAYLSGLGDNTAAYVDKAIDALISADPNAYWDTKKSAIAKSCAQANPPCSQAKNGLSPRVLTVALFDPSVYDDCRLGKTCSPSGMKIQVTNIAGFFIDCGDKDGKNIKDPKKCAESFAGGKFNGRLMPVPGITGKSGVIDRNFSFLRSIGMLR